MRQKRLAMTIPQVHEFSPSKGASLDLVSQEEFPLLLPVIREAPSVVERGFLTNLTTVAAV